VRICRLYAHEANQIDKQDQMKAMNTLITHRGPDDEGYYVDDYFHFGFKRLSIIDIECGHPAVFLSRKRRHDLFCIREKSILFAEKDPLNKKDLQHSVFNTYRNLKR
jgi:asparagine synthase (glutamine-hydrolysing)